MGYVYRVEHLGLGRSFALKVLRPELIDERQIVQRFERESRLSASLASEHVVGIVDAGELEDGSPFYLMEWLPGRDLRHVLRAEAPLVPSRVVRWAVDICRGLDAAHKNGLIHRDLKPENALLVRGDDGREIVKLVDFGIAKVTGNLSTRPGALLGTVRYMAPEQIGLEAPVSAATDVYALGVMLYECLSSVAPFDGDTTERILYRIMNERPRPLGERCPELPDGLAELVDRAMTRDPRQRLQSARELCEQLLPFSRSGQASPSWLVPVPSELEAEGTATVREGSSPQAFVARPRRPRALGWVVSGLLGVGLGAVVMSFARPGAAPSASASALPKPRVELPRAASLPPSALSEPGFPAPPAPSSTSSVHARSSAAPARLAPRAEPSTSARAPVRVPTPSFDPENPYGR